MKRILNLLSTLIAVQLVFADPAHDLFANEPAQEKSAVFAKIVLPMKSPNEKSQPVVESWIARKLRKRGATQLRAVTNWVRLAGKGEHVRHVWNATLDGKGWGCPVVGRVAERTADGKIEVELSGWSPVGARIKGQTISAEVGSRTIAVVDTGGGDENGIAYVAFFVGPAVPNTQEIKSPDKQRVEIFLLERKKPIPGVTRQEGLQLNESGQGPLSYVHQKPVFQFTKEKVAECTVKNVGFGSLPGHGWNVHIKLTEKAKAELIAAMKTPGARNAGWFIIELNGKMQPGEFTTGYFASGFAEIPISFYRTEQEAKNLCRVLLSN